MMQTLKKLQEQWGESRINQAIQPVFIGIDDDETTDICVLNAAVNDRELWKALNSDEQNLLHIAHIELQYDTREIMESLHELTDVAPEY